MIKPPIPHDDEARIVELNNSGVLDTGREERFDRFTRLAQRMFKVPVAAISLIDRDTQHFKSIQGSDQTRTGRDESFCGHAILGDDVFVVEDTHQDQRFFDNPLVTAAKGIRFYAGCPLLSPTGKRLGALCIVDHVPRQFSSQDIEALADLGELVADELGSFRLATVCELTGLSNRRVFNLIADQALQMCARNNAQASLLMLNIDGFGQINRQLGCAYGDKALVEFSHLMRVAFRNSDVVCRLGADEFCVLLTDTDFENSWTSVERFREALELRNQFPGRKYRLMFSAGVVQCDHRRHETTTRLLHDAEVVMHERKRAKPLPQRVSSVCA